jgi:hypothetical protein
MGFFGFVTIVCGLLFYIFWRRRKLIFTKFLSPTGQWEGKSWMPKDISAEFEYDGEQYKYNIKKCTRDHLNRPIAHYYKGNPEQQMFNFAETNKKLMISGEELTIKDFTRLMSSKVIRDIFQDDEVINLLYLIILVVAVLGIATIICIFAKSTPPVHLVNDNETINIIARGVKLGMSKGFTG